MVIQAKARLSFLVSKVLYIPIRIAKREADTRSLVPRCLRDGFLRGWYYLHVAGFPGGSYVVAGERGGRVVQDRTLGLWVIVDALQEFCKVYFP